MSNETDYRRQLHAIGAERAYLVRSLETVTGQVKMKDGGRGYDIPAPTSAQTKQMRKLNAMIARCDEALAALATLS